MRVAVPTEIKNNENRVAMTPAGVDALVHREGLGLPQATRLVSLGPARAAGLNDRGEIAVGLRADLISVARPGGQAAVERVWCAGKPVFAVDYQAR